MKEGTPGAPGAFDGADDDKKKSSLFGKFNNRLQDAVQQGRGEEVARKTVTEKPARAPMPADDLALRSAQSLTLQRMIVPEGVVIEGAMTSNSETLIAGRVNGDVNVEGGMTLESSGFVGGGLQVTSCTIQGQVKGNVESAHELIIGEHGRVHAAAIAGKDMTIAGTVRGNVKCGGVLRLMASSKLSGNVSARTVVIDEGAVFNGKCSMGRPKQASAERPRQEAAR